MKMAENGRKDAEVLKPLLTLINLYGVGWKSERGCGWRCLKRLSCVIFSIMYAWTAILLLFMFFHSLQYYRKHNLERLPEPVNLVIVIVGVNAISFVVCLIQRGHLKTLDRFFKQLHLNKEEEEGVHIGRWRKTVRMVSTYLCAVSLLYFLTAWHGATNHVTDAPSSLELLLRDPEEIIWLLTRYGVVAFCLLALFFSFASASLVCFVAHYLSASCQDSFNRLRRCQSPMRRVRMSGGLLRKYARLNKIVAAADGIGAITMYTLKMGAVIIFLSAAFAFLPPTNTMTEMVANGFLLAFCSTYLVIYCYFVRMAHSANGGISNLSKSLAEVWRADDPVLYTVPGHSRLHLLRMRVDQLIGLTHLMIDRPTFTLLGEPVDGQNLFTLCTDFVDNANSLSAINNKFNA